MLAPDRSAAATRPRRARLVLVGTSHHVAALAVRERLAAADPAALQALVSTTVGPAVVLQTCNRLEVYAWSDRPRAASAIRALLAKHAGVAPATLRSHLYTHTGTNAVQHLIRVAAGLDSLALGESQVLGQVRSAWQAAAARGQLPSQVHTVFSRAIEAARRIRSEGGFSHHPSVAALGVEAGAHAIGGLAGRSAAVLGAGATGKLALQALAAAGATGMLLLNRSPERAAQTAHAASLGQRVQVAGLDALPAALATVDLVVCATAATVPIVTAAIVAGALPSRGGRPLVLVDVAMPRDVEPAVAALPGVTLIDLDTLEAHCALDAGARHQALARSEDAARQAALDCIAALRLREVAPEIAAVRSRAEAVRQAALRRAAGKLQNLNPRERAVVEQLTYTIVQKLLHAPTVALRQTAADPPKRARQRRSTILNALSVQANAPAMRD